MALPTALYNYTFEQVSASWGEIILGGYGRGEGLSLVPQADDWALIVGNRGDGVRSKIQNYAYTITATLHQGTPVNDLLAAARQLDLINGQGARPLLVQDKSGRTVFRAERCYIKRVPDVTFNDEASTRQWIFETHNGTMFVGGNGLA